jgi:uncharacterized protein
MPANKNLQIAVENHNEVDALLQLPTTATRLLVLAHGAGAGMHHPFMELLATELAAVNIATLRYQFPYMQQSRRIPDAPAALTSTVAAAVQAAKKIASGLPLLAGGKSLGARMTSQAAAQNLLHEVLGLVFFGFPLHPPNRSSTKRAEHLSQVQLPMLFLQGTRDTFADLPLLHPICANLAPRATLHPIDQADHSFHVPKRSGRTDAEILRELAATTANWANSAFPQT